jgi:hypothetical protein
MSPPKEIIDDIGKTRTKLLKEPHPLALETGVSSGAYDTVILEDCQDHMCQII